MNTTSKILAILTITGLLLAGSIGTADAQTGGQCVEFGTRFVRTVTPETETRPLELPAGQYTVTIHTSDSYPERPAAVLEDQNSERVSVFGATTDDLPDGVETGELTTNATITLDTAVTEVTATHVHGGHGWQSVLVGAVCFAPVPVTHPAVEVPEVAPAPQPEPVPAPQVEATPAPVAELPVMKAPHFNG